MRDYEFKNSAKMRKSSICYYIKSYFNDTVSGYKLNISDKDSCIAMYIPNINLGIEYITYKRTEEAIVKAFDRVCEINKHINLIVITENTHNSIEKIVNKNESKKLHKYKEIHVVHNNEKSLEDSIKTTIKYINDLYNEPMDNLKIDLKKDRENIKKYFNQDEKGKSFISQSETIYKKWNIKTTSDTNIEHIKPNSNIVVTCKCPKCSREWDTTIEYINIKKDSVCPYCNNRRVEQGYNDLATTHPKLAEEWHPTKNGTLRPTDIVAGANRKVYWQHTVHKDGIEYIHEWDSYVKNRALKNYKCPYCSNKKVLEGYNDLATTHPKLAEEWHPTKNGNLRPTDIVAGSNKNIWWICSNNHAWESKTYRRTKLDEGCPKCKKHN